MRHGGGMNAFSRVSFTVKGGGERWESHHTLAKVSLQASKPRFTLKLIQYHVLLNGFVSYILLYIIILIAQTNGALFIYTVLRYCVIFHTNVPLNVGCGAAVCFMFCSVDYH